MAFFSPRMLPYLEQIELIVIYKINENVIYLLSDHGWQTMIETSDVQSANLPQETVRMLHVTYISDGDIRKRLGQYLS